MSKLTAFDYYNSAKISIVENNLDQAIQNLKKAIFLEKNFSQAYFLLSILYASKNLKKETLKTLLKLIELEPNNLWHYNNLALFYFLNQDFTKAEKAMIKCLEINPNFIIVYPNLYLIYRTICDWKKSEEIEKKLDELSIDSPFINILRFDDFEKNLQSAKLLVNNFLNNLPKVNFSYQRREKHNKIR